MKLLILIVGLLCVPLTACKTTSPERTVYNVEKTVITTAAAARDAWAVWYVHERNRLVSDSVGLAALEAKRAQVNAAWFHFQNVANIIILAQEAGFSNTNGLPSQVSAGLTDAAQPFINLITSLIK